MCAITKVPYCSRTSEPLAANQRSNDNPPSEAVFYWEKTLKQSKWKKVPCDHCKAPPGSPCRGIAGQRIIRPHSTRLDKASNIETKFTPVMRKF
jgi:hypothetical protein